MKDEKDPKDKVPTEIPPVDPGRPGPSPSGSTEGPGAPEPPADPPAPPGSTEGPGGQG